MRLLVIGSDRNIFKKNSDIWNRYLDYGKLFEEIHVVVFSRKNLGNKNIKIGENVFIYPTNHIRKLFYFLRVCKIAGQIFRSPSFVDHKLWAVSSQDAFEAGFAGWLIKKIYKIPLQIQVHTDFLSPYFWQESFINKLRVILAKFLIPRADSIRVVSERIRQSIVAGRLLYVAKINILPIFVDTQLIKNTPIKTNLHKKYPKFDFIILMISRLTKEKNIGLAIEAMTELVKRHPKLGLVVVGSGPELKKIQLKTRNFELDGNVKFEDWSDDPFSYYKTADLFLLSSNYEGYGRSLIEAMAAGLPIVTTCVGLAGEVVINGKNGIVVPVGNKNKLVEGISVLIAEKDRREELGVNAIKTIEKLTTKEHYLKLYKEIIESIVVNYEKQN